MIQFYSDIFLKFIKPDTWLIIRHDPSSKPMKLTGLGNQVIEMLRRGTTRDEIISGNIELYSIRDRKKLDRVLKDLKNANLIYSDDVIHSYMKLERTIILNIDPISNILSYPIRKQSVYFRKLMLPSIWIICTVYSVLFFLRGRLDFIPSLEIISLLIVVSILSIYFLLHELSHGVACRAIGYEVSFAGIRFNKLTFPSFFVDTRLIHLHENKFEKSSVAFAGLVADIAILSALIALYTNWNVSNSGVSVGLYYSIIMVGMLCLFNCSPFSHNDFTNSMKFLTENHRLPERYLNFKSNKVWSFTRILFLLYCTAYLFLFSFLFIKFARFSYFLIQSYLN